ncbi:MAG: hypothetical protein ACP5D7_12405 [Limnospira sp.]
MNVLLFWQVPPRRPTGQAHRSAKDTDRTSEVGDSMAWFRERRCLARGRPVNIRPG